MGLDVWFAEDIRNALMAADESSSSTAGVCAAVGGDQVTLRAYLESYRAALATVALAFGLSPKIITGRRLSASSGQRATLEVEVITVSREEAEYDRSFTDLIEPPRIGG